jgi:hypothetical protein
VALLVARSESGFMIVVHPSLPVKSVKELIAYDKANPGKLSEMLKRDVAKWQEVVKARNIKPEGRFPECREVAACRN